MSRNVQRHEDLPPSDDPVWRRWSQDVLDELREGPKTTEQLKVWARGAKVEIGRLINTLSWMDLRGLVKPDRSSGVTVWKLLPVVDPVAFQPPQACPHCGGSMKREPERAACVQCGRSVYAPIPD